MSSPNSSSLSLNFSFLVYRLPQALYHKIHNPSKACKKGIWYYLSDRSLSLEVLDHWVLLIVDRWVMNLGFGFGGFGSSFGGGFCVWFLKKHEKILVELILCWFLKKMKKYGFEL